MERGRLPWSNFSNPLGPYNTPVTGAEPTGIDWSGWRTELPFTKANLPTLTLDGVSVCVESFSIDFGIQVSRRNLPGCRQTILTGDEITGGMKIVAPTVADKVWHSRVEAHAWISMVALSLQYETVAGGTRGDHSSAHGAEDVRRVPRELARVVSVPPMRDAVAARDGIRVSLAKARNLHHTVSTI